jgi:hypothetical protein
MPKPVKRDAQIIFGIRSGLRYVQAMSAVKPGVKVLARDALGDLLERRAITGVETENGNQVVWLCKEQEWLAAESEDRQPEGFPWPAEDVSADTAHFANPS